MKKPKKRTCNKCNQEKLLKEFYYHRLRKKYMNSCKKCNSKQCAKYQRESGYRKSEKYVFYQRAYGIKHDRNTKNGKCVPVMENLKEHLIDLWKNQKQECYYTGTKMEINGYHINPLAMTVDRIVPKLGYVEGNIVLCCAIVNRMKQNLSIDELEYWCKELLKSIKRIKKSNAFEKFKVGWGK